jgi:hypothetical protein
MYFLSRTQLITALGAVLLALTVLELVRRRKLSEEYSVLWVIASVVIALLGFSTRLLTWVTHTLGFLFESSTTFAFGLGFTVVMLLYHSLKQSRLTIENHALARELALLREEVETLRQGRSDSPR